VKGPNPIITSSYAFALRIVRLYQYLVSTKKEYILAKQVLRSGTSIGANIYESQHAQSRKDFISKMSIGFKEAHETEYWLMLLKDAHYISNNQYEDLSKDLVVIMKLLTAIIKSSKSNLEH